MADQQDVLRPGELEERVDSRFDERLDDDAIAAIEEAEREAPDPEEFGLKVAAPTGEMAIRATNLGVRYNLNFTKKTKLHTTFANMLDPRRRKKGHFWALRGVDLEIKRGEAVGIIGPNGSGKSTVLLAMAGILQPSEGVVEVNGHVSTLLSLNAGFDQELTGKENIALAGALMGIDHEVMQEITPGIIQFANIGAFINAPMKTYSSGMRARVGFSIATAVDPDILLLDEVMGTGDNKFKRKSKQRIAEVLHSAKAVVMVTHDMSWITAFCTRAILLDKGRIVADGDPETIADMHEDDAAQRKVAKRKAKQMMKDGLIKPGSVNKVVEESMADKSLSAQSDAATVAQSEDGPDAATAADAETESVASTSAKQETPPSA
jgi:ABC-2 type transport system ATP-binding protein